MGPSARAEQKERREIIRNEKLRPGDQPATTFHALANLDTSLEGRFATGGYVSGSEQAVNYPAGPSWTRDQVGIEPPLGQDVNFQEPCGEAFEVERSLTHSSAAPASIPGSQTGEGPTAPSPESPKVVATLSSSSVATTTSHERLAQILPRLAVAVPKLNRRKV
jgi:hypothetical protein